MRPCTGCGAGVANIVGLCMSCGYRKNESRIRMRKLRAFNYEFMRLAAIDISN
jgi:hypothetical protein